MYIDSTSNDLARKLEITGTEEYIDTVVVLQ